MRGRDDAAGRRRVAQFQLQLLGLFLHSHSPKFADGMKNFHRWPSIILHGGDFSALQISVPDFLPIFETIILIRAIVAIALLSSVGMPRKGYVVVPALKPLERSRVLVSMNFCPLDINRRASSARAPISSLNHS